MFWGQRQSLQHAPRVQNISALELKQKLESADAPIVVDVRTVEEFQQEGHISGARLLPLALLPLRRAEIPADREVVMVCRSGARSHMATEHLLNNGYSRVYNLNGGMIAWKQAGLATS